MAALMLPSAVLTRLNAGLRAAAGRDGLVAASGIGDTGETRHPSLTTVQPEPRQRRAPACRPGLSRPRPRTGSCPPPALAAGAFAAEISAVDLDLFRQLLARVPLHHDLFQLVLNFPGRGLGDAEAPAQLDAGDPLLALGQWYMARNQVRCGSLGSKDGPGDQRGLPATGGALEQVAAFGQAVLASPASRADEPLRLSRGEDNRAAEWLGAVQAFKGALAQAFLDLSRIACHQTPPPNTRCS
jgi:hypothetical protein